MAENSKIEWTDHTFNPWIGCTKVGPGCDHCYAEQRMDTRLHRVQWGSGHPRQLTKTWGDPVRWNKQHAAFYAEHGRRQRVFCASLADVFDNEVPPQWRVDLFALIQRTPSLDWLLLTKRIGNVRAMLPETVVGGELPPNVWLGATVVNQAEADRDVPKLLQAPARVRFLSIEPMLGPICIERATDQADEGTIDWVIAGGESGAGARPAHPEWFAQLRNECEAFGVPFLFKQWGEWMPESAMTLQQRMRDCGQLESLLTKLDGRTHWIDADDHEPFDASDVRMVKIGKKAAGRLLDGRTHDGFPEARA